MAASEEITEQQANINPPSRKTGCTVFLKKDNSKTATFLKQICPTAARRETMISRIKPVVIVMGKLPSAALHLDAWKTIIPAKRDRT
jgi:hypothetical protein